VGADPVSDFGMAFQIPRNMGQEVRGLAFGPDGKRLVGAAADKTLKVWDATTGEELLSLEGHAEPVVGVCFSRDGTRIASVAKDGTVIVWEAGPPAK